MMFTNRYNHWDITLGKWGQETSENGIINDNYTYDNRTLTFHQ